MDQIADAFCYAISELAYVKPALDSTSVYNYIKQSLQQASCCIIVRKDYKEGISIMTSVISAVNSIHVDRSQKSLYEHKRERVHDLSIKILKLTCKLFDKNEQEESNSRTIMELQKEIRELRDRIKVLETTKIQP